MRKTMNDEIKYEMVIYWSEDDDAYIAEVPELPGCMADGRTYEDAIKNTLTVIREWIETASELGREIPIPKGRLIYA
jgi:predicted RNase H-like HicB family nuclease